MLRNSVFLVLVTNILIEGHYWPEQFISRMGEHPADDSKLMVVSADFLSLTDYLSMA